MAAWRSVLVVAAVLAALSAPCEAWLFDWLFGDSSTGASGTVGGSPEFAEFEGWFKENGGKAPGLTLARFPGMGTGIKATQTVDDGDLALDVPLRIVLCRDTLAAESDRYAAASRSVRDDEDLVALALMRERALGSGSRWAPYLEVLPRAVPQTASFNDAELDAVQDASVASAAKLRKKEIAARYSRLQDVLSALVDDISAADRPTLATYQWALALVNSRALTIQGRKYLVPFADMFNYQPHTEQRRAESGAHFLKYHKLGRDTFKVLVDRHTEPGQQLFEDYGDNDNRLYLEHHGFVAMDNPFDCVDLALPPLEGDEALVARKAKMLDDLGSDGPHLQRCVSPGKHVTRRLYARLVVSKFSKEDMDKCAPVEEGARDPDSMEACLGEGVGGADGVDDRARRALRDAAAAQLQAYPTSLEEDEKLWSSGKDAMSDGMVSALAFRLSRKRLLRRIQRSLEPLVGAAGGDAGEAGEAAGGDPAEAAAASQPPTEGGSAEVDNSLEAIIERFNAWFEAANPPVSLIEAQAVPGMRIGTIAMADISAEELYLSVPTDLIMSAESAALCPHLSVALADIREEYPRGDAFHELLFHLMYERFVLKDKSFYWPYLQTLPTSEEMGFPVFYPPKLVKELKGSLVETDVVQLQGEVDRKYDGIKRAIFDKWPQHFDESVFTRDNYRWAHAVLDSRSIWWGGARHLVPMLDLINCKEGPDPTRVHSTQLDDSGKFANTLAPWAFKAGEQVFENYGQPNYTYFMYHGFSLEENTHDCVRVLLQMDHAADNAELVVEKLKKAGFRGPSLPVCLAPGVELPDMARTFLSITRGAETAPDVRAVLRDVVEAALDGYPTTLAEDEDILASGNIEWPESAPITFRATEKRLLIALANAWSATEL